MGRVLINNEEWRHLGLYRVPSPAAKADAILQRLMIEAEGGEMGVPERLEEGSGWRIRLTLSFCGR